jgi:pimeloyl-ACP methyl ester carboxylesterase
LNEDTRFLNERLRNDASGLASSLRLCGTGAQVPLWDRLGAIEVPVLVLAGEKDLKFAALGKRIVDSIGVNALFSVVQGSGHATHLERPDATAALVSEFLLGE